MENKNITKIDVNIERKRLFSGFEGEACKDSPDICVTKDKIWLTIPYIALKESDISRKTEISLSKDGGVTFGKRKYLPMYSYREGNMTYIFNNGHDFYSEKNDRIISLGFWVKMPDGAKEPLLNRVPAYLIRDPQTFKVIGKPQTLPFPIDSPSVCPHGQPMEYDNGDILFSFYYSETVFAEKYRSVAVLYSFDGEKLTVAQAGTPIKNDNLIRGYAEPSVVKYGDKYYITLRSDENAYLALSDDGLNYGEPFLWKWDDGSILGSCNTQQRWVGLRDGLYLVYTRYGVHNDHVFRNRAPLFMARCDEEKKCLIKETEIVLVPELGASLASMIGFSKAGEDKAYITVAENMQWHPDWYAWWNVAKYGSDNSIWLVKITSI